MVQHFQVLSLSLFKIGLVLVKAAELTAQDTMDRKMTSFPSSLFPVYLRPALEEMSQEERGLFFLQILLKFEFRSRSTIQAAYYEECIKKWLCVF